MLNKTQQKTLERQVGSLDLIPESMKQILIEAFLKSLEIERKQKLLEQRYSTCAGTEDTPDRKMKRYRQEKAIHNGLVHGIVCSCFREDTAAVPCAYVPDKIVGPLRGYYAEHGIWWKV
jgi:hypothetical protein